MVQFLRLIFRTCNVIKELKNIEATTTELSKATALHVLTNDVLHPHGLHQNMSRWVEENIVHLFPHWNFRGREGEIIQVWAWRVAGRISYN